MTENVIIIGGGPAGLAAAIYNARAGLKPLLFAGSPPGGQLTLTSEVENYPGFESILGPELIQKMRDQAIKFGTRIIDANVMKVDFSKRPFEIYLADLADSVTRDASLLRGSAQIPQSASRKVSSLVTPTKFTIASASSVIIATGAKALWLGLESETRLRGKGVSACATCDGFFFKGKTVAVVGGGDTALEEALTLTKFASKVYIIHRRNEFRASKIMQERVGVGHDRPVHNGKIKIIYNTIVEEIIGEKKVEGVRLSVIATLSEVEGEAISSTNGIATGSSSPRNDKEQILNLDGVFIAIGHKPDTDIFKGQIELDQKGYIITKQSATSVEGVFAAGDCVDHLYRQVATAVGMGVAAALDIERYLEEK